MSKKTDRDLFFFNASELTKIAPGKQALQPGYVPFHKRSRLLQSWAVIIQARYSSQVHCLKTNC